MIELKTEYPYNNKNSLIRHYAEDENGVKYNILQNETGIKYGEAVDIYPCRYTYSATNEIIEEVVEEVEEIVQD